LRRRQQPIFANGATLAGHVIVEDYATVGAFSPVHQFCRVGRYAYIGACTVITQDVPPFSRVVTERETPLLWREHRRPRAPAASIAERIETIEARLSLLVALQAQHHAGDRTDARATQRFARRAELVAFIESAERGLHQVVPPAPPAHDFLQGSIVSAHWGLIAGNGQFPFLVLEAARSQGIDMAVIAIARRGFAGP
jgi:hypothetical protein